MASQDPRDHRPSLYPTVDQSNPNPLPTTTPSSSSLYPSIPMEDLATNHFSPDNRDHMPTGANFTVPSAPPQSASREETVTSVPGAIIHLIDNQYSVQLACGVFSIIRLWQGDDIVAVLARVADDVQWPLIKHDAAVKVDDSHYFFTLRPPSDSGSDSDEEERKDKGMRKGEGQDQKKEKEISNSNYDPLNYGLSFASKGQEKLLEELDRVLEMYCSFSVQKVSVKSKVEVLDGSLARETSPEELEAKGKREQMEESCTAYWTTLAPNVEDYSGKAAKLIAGGSGQLIKGILWCGDVTVDRLKWGNEFLKNRMSSSEKAEIDPKTMNRIRRAKNVTKMTQNVATGVLSGVLKVSGYFMTSFANSTAGKKFFSMLPGEILLASLDGFTKICDAAEVAGKSVLSTSSTVTTDLVTHKYGEEAGQATGEGLGAAGHAFGTAWAAFKIRKALNPKNAVKASSLAKSAAKSAATEYKAKKASK